MYLRVCIVTGTASVVSESVAVNNADALINRVPGRVTQTHVYHRGDRWDSFHVKSADCSLAPGLTPQPPLSPSGLSLALSLFFPPPRTISPQHFLS